MIDDEKIIEMFFGRSEQGIRELDTSDEKVSEQNLLAKLISFLFYKGSRENRLSFFYAYEQKGAPNHDKAKRENPRGAASRD